MNDELNLSNFKRAFGEKRQSILTQEFGNETSEQQTSLVPAILKPNAASRSQYPMQIEHGNLGATQTQIVNQTILSAPGNENIGDDVVNTSLNESFKFASQRIKNE